MPRVDRDKELGKIIESELARAGTYWQTELDEERDRAMDAFTGRNRKADTEEDGSGYHSDDVASTVQASLAEMVDSLTSDTVCEFLANDKDDEDAAQLETDVVNNLVIHSEEGQAELLQALHDGLLLRNAILKVEVEETIEKRTTIVPDIEPGDIGMLLLSDNPQERLSATEVEDTPKSWAIASEITKRALRFKAIPPARMVFSLEHESISLEDCPFYAEEMFKTRSELVSMGISRTTVYKLRSTSRTTDVRGRKVQPVDPEGGETINKSQELIKVWDVGIKHDQDDDGIGELIRCLYAEEDKKVMLRRPYPFPWYSIGTTEIVPHSLLGRSVYDRIKQVSKQKTEVVRQWADNMKYNNQNELTVLDGEVNPDDVLTRAPGKPIRQTRENAIGTLPVPDIGANSRLFLAYLDEQRSEMGGASLDIQTSGAQIAGDTASGIDRQYSKREKVSELQLRTVALTLIRGAFKIAHASLRTWSPGPSKAQFRGDWVDYDSKSWEPRDKVRVIPAISGPERERRVAALDRVITQQTTAFSAGGEDVLVSMSNIHAAVIEQGRLARVDTPQRFWIDPQSEASKQANKAKKDTAQAAATDQSRAAAMILEIQTNLTQWKDNVEYRFKYFDKLLAAEVEIAKAIGVETGKLEALQAVGEGQMLQRGAGELEADNDLGKGNGGGPGAAGGGAGGAGLQGIPPGV